MFNYIVRRTLYMIPILFGIALVVFILFNMVGGDPVLMMLGKHVNQQAINDLRAELGLNKPLYMQFFDFCKQIVTMDFGRSYATKQDIFDMMKATAPVSFVVALPAFIVSVVFAIALALLVAFWRGSWFDRIVVIGCVVLISVPSLAYILFGQYFLAYQLGWFPISGFAWGFPDTLSYIGLPTLILIALSLGGELRFYRTIMLDEVYQDYIRTARSKGLSERVVMFKHVLKNAMIPIITTVVIEIPFLITGSLLVESFFGIPGMGAMIVDALNTSDFPVLKASVVVLSIFYMIANLVSDILYSLVDPRITLK